MPRDKYRIHEVAKDFNVTSKVISQILTDYIAAPKNHMQVLETNELDVIFEYMKIESYNKDNLSNRKDEFIMSDYGLQLYSVRDITKIDIFSVKTSFFSQIFLTLAKKKLKHGIY